MAAIEVEQLTKEFGTVLAVDRLSFTVRSGRLAGFLGPNGAGKSTTLRMLLGLVRPTSGTATINGYSYRRLPDRSGQVGALLDAAAIPGGRTGRGHLRIRALSSRVDPARIDTVLDLVEMSDSADRRIGGYSLGMRQRLGIAAALLGDPDILILDEPANGLDPEGVRWLRSLLRRRAEAGRTVLVSSHILAEVAQIADDIVILNHGTLVIQSPLADLLASSRPVIRIRTPQADRFRSVLLAAGARVDTPTEDQLEVTDLAPDEVARLAADHSVPVLESSTESAGLEDLFFRLTADPPGQSGTGPNLAVNEAGSEAADGRSES